MKTKVTKRGQVSVPARVRKQLHIGPDTTLEWVVEGATARVIPVPADPVRAFRGSGKKGMVKRLLKDRRQDREKEDALHK
jgi:AbrB family looped-hinge helix DNA binding protein